MTYSKQDAIDALQKYAEEHGEAPSSKDWPGHTPSYHVIYDLFGSWSDAIEAAGLQSRDDKNRKPVNSGYFKEVDAPTSAYWLGLLFGDGNIHDYGNRYQLRLELTDIELVEQFQEDVESEHTITYSENEEEHQPTARIAIGDRKFCENLIESGITPNKTFEGTPPSLVPDLRPHFVRGLYDADGHLANSDWRITGASIDALEMLSDWIPVKVGIYEDSREDDSSYTLFVTKGNWDELFKWLYPRGSETTPMLERKNPNGYNHYSSRQ